MAGGIFRPHRAEKIDAEQWRRERLTTLEPVFGFEGEYGCASGSQCALRSSNREQANDCQNAN
jgi:hypothetical protein